MVIHKIDDIIIYTTSSIFDESSQRDVIEKQIAEWIVDNYEYNIILDILNRNYEGFNEKDKREIVTRTIMLLSRSRLSREIKIENCLKNYLKSENKINVQGFVRFRLKDYREELEKVIDEAIDKYIVEKEYHEFIELLKEYVSHQMTMISYLNVIVTGDDIYYQNKNGDNIKREMEEGCFFDDDLTKEDKLLTVLVINAPEKIVIHCAENFENNEILKTIESIFEEKVIFCKGCKICRKD